MFLIEKYAINGVTGTWSLTNTERLNEYDKRKVLADAKSKGYEYDRKERAYIVKADGDLYDNDRAIVITRYQI